VGRPDDSTGYEGWYLEPRWPGLEAERDGVTFDADKLKKVAQDLEKKLKIFDGSKPGSLAHLMANTDLSDQRAIVRSIERWPGGHAFFDTLKTANVEFPDVYSQIVTRLRVAIALVQAGAGIYGGADTSSTTPGGNKPA
jgi:hypothetical protein